MGAFTTTVIDGIARLELDVRGESVNTISRAVREEMEKVLDSLQRDAEVNALIIISGKPDSFIAGADIDEFVALKTREEAMALVRGGQELVNRMEFLGKPTVAAIHGSCLGGGLEAALACTYRVATEHPKTMLGLPEVQLGIIPAAGGCQRLPRLIGARGALDVILAGKTLRATQAFRHGIVDDLVHPAILEDVALEVARRLAEGWRPKRARGGVLGLLLDRNSLGRRVVLSQARKAVMKKSGGHYPAPLAAIEAVDHGLKYGMSAGLDSEAAHFAELAVGEVSRNLVQIFFATTSLKKDPGVEGEVPSSKQVRNVAIVGAGFMGSAIAGVAAARAKVDVRLRDTTVEAVANGLQHARALLQRRLERRRISKHEFDRLRELLSGGDDWSGFRRADVVIEAVFEDLHVKREVFGAVEVEVRSDCVIASNTSTIPITSIAESVKHPEHVVGMHFFSPVDKMPLLEVIVTSQTAPWVTVTAVAFGRAMGKTVIVVRDRPGFWVNRILAPYLNEAGRLFKEGVSVEAIDRSMTAFGFPVGPIALLDEIGLDVALKASSVLHDAYGDRMKPMDGLGRMTEQGRLGRKSGRGFYEYADGKNGKKRVDPVASEIIGVAEEARVAEEDITRRMVYAMLNEAAWALDEGVVRSVRDADVGAIFGIGFPPFRGGPLRYLDTVGGSQAVANLQELAGRYGDRFEPAPTLVRLAGENQSFHPNS
jgi:3-hydroxyacyl-CoA dehydrogenase/enoyl-CoA hydratase/3-hydroxybutyryl-CoA epimerase